MLQTVAMPGQLEWKLGDWCIFSYRICQITGMSEGQVTSVSDGRNSMRGTSLNKRCVPLTLENKSFAEDYQAAVRETDDWSSLEFLNHAGIRDHLVSLFDAACRKAGGEARKDALTRAQRFISEAKVRVDQLRQASVENVPLLKQKSAKPAVHDDVG